MFQGSVMPHAEPQHGKVFRGTMAESIAIAIGHKQRAYRPAESVLLKGSTPELHNAHRARERSRFSELTGHFLPVEDELVL